MKIDGDDLIISFFIAFENHKFVGNSVSKMKNVLRFIWAKLRNKYLLVFVFFFVWILYFDEHSLMQHFHNRQKLEQLRDQKELYSNKIEADKRKLHELQTNDENLEKFAREQFQMKKENEDIFIIVEGD